MGADDNIRGETPFNKQVENARETYRALDRRYNFIVSQRGCQVDDVDIRCLLTFSGYELDRLEQPLVGNPDSDDLRIIMECQNEGLARVKSGLQLAKKALSKYDNKYREPKPAEIGV